MQRNLPVTVVYYIAYGGANEGNNKEDRKRHGNANYTFERKDEYNQTKK
jgi:hypothetical protein